jgi:glycosyltransferase involved in cell wall biosynthesis
MGDLALCRTPSVRDLLVQQSDADVTRLDGIVDKDTIEAVTESPRKSEVWRAIDGEIKLVFVGRLVEVKNPTKLPEIVSELPQEFSLLIVGDGPERKAVESAIKEECVSERVHLAGGRPHREALYAISEADLLLLPSEVESYGAVVFGALSFSTPVLATPFGVLPSIDPPLLTTAELSVFEDVLSTIDLETDDGIDEETLDRFSVDRFTQNVRTQLVAVTE